MIPILLILLASAAYANEEITIDLPGGATIEMVWIEPGTFVMESPDSVSYAYAEEEPQHRVTITNGFGLGERMAGFVRDAGMAI